MALAFLMASYGSKGCFSSSSSSLIAQQQQQHCKQNLKADPICLDRKGAGGSQVVLTEAQPQASTAASLGGLGRMNSVGFPLFPQRCRPCSCFRRPLLQPAGTKRTDNRQLDWEQNAGPQAQIFPLLPEDHGLSSRSAARTHRVEKGLSLLSASHGRQ